MTFDSTKAREEILDYLTSPSNNQVKGFYDFDGYWQNKDEAMKELTPERKANLTEYWAIMMSITPEELTKLTHDKWIEWAGKYTPGNGRSSRYREAIHNAAKSKEIATKNMEILQRTRFHVGCCVGYFNKEEVSKMVQNVIDGETGEKAKAFWKDEDARLSNCIFRLKILRTYLEASPYLGDINIELKNWATKRLELHNITRDAKVNDLGIRTVVELMELQGKW